ncbi:MAG: glutamine amidotransferase, partial [Gammaproteobacteria bacterium]|nr:glutamine amidotransferase [Gammaproteobacteria bacterium]
MKKLFIIKAGSTFKETADKYGDFEDMTLRGLGTKPDIVETINACGGQELPAPDTCYGAVITGAHCMVTD